MTPCRTFQHAETSIVFILSCSPKSPYGVIFFWGLNSEGIRFFNVMVTSAPIHPNKCHGLPECAGIGGPACQLSLPLHCSFIE